MLHTWMGLWNKMFLNNDFRQFIFFERNNCLKLNTRASHYLPDVDRKCTFCRIIYGSKAEDETYTHLFFECRTTKKLLNHTINNLTPELANIQELKSIFWLGREYTDLRTDTCTKYLLIFETFRYIIWKKNYPGKFQAPCRY